MYIARPSARKPSPFSDTSAERAELLDRERREFIRTAAIAYGGQTQITEGGDTDLMWTPEGAVQRAQQLWAAIEKAGC